MFDLVYKLEDLNPEYYRKVAMIPELQEIEHQIGRLSNFRDIITECANYPGDFVEFGCWQGFSLLWTAYFMERAAIYNKRLLGLDGFIGLPYADGTFAQGAFSDTSLERCRNAIRNSPSLYQETKKNVFVEQFLYAQRDDILAFLQKNQFKKFSFIHIDCDVSQSAIEIFAILWQGNLIADDAFILFDDYGCESSLASTIHEIFSRMNSGWHIAPYSATQLTKNYKLKRIG